MKSKQINKITGYENIKNYYIIYEDGRCININTNKFRKIVLTHDGYPSYKLGTIEGGSKEIKIHRILAQWLVPNPNNLPFVRHLDDDKLNYDLCNLAWGTRVDNAQDSIKNGRYRYGYKIHNNRPIICIETGTIYESSCEASRKLKINQSNISACCLGKRKIAGGYHWKYINEREENK